MVLLSPSLVRLKTPLADSLRLMERLGCESVHIDVCSNLTIPNFFKVEEVRSARIQNYHTVATVHLFQPFNDNPPDLAFLQPQDLVMLHVFPQTRRPTIEAFLKATHVAGCRTGLAMDITTLITSLVPYLANLDTLFVMAIQAGGYALKSDIGLPRRVDQVRAILQEFNQTCRIGIDGGVNDKTFPRMARLADELVVGSLLLHADNLALQWSKLQHIAKGDN